MEGIGDAVRRGDAEADRVGAGGCDVYGVAEPLPARGPAEIVPTAAGSAVRAGLQVDAVRAVTVGAAVDRRDVVGHALPAGVVVRRLYCAGYRCRATPVGAFAVAVLPTVAAQGRREAGAGVAVRGVPGAQTTDGVAADGGVARGRRVVKTCDDDPVEPGVEDGVVRQVRARRGGEADPVIDRLNDRVVGHGGVGDGPGGALSRRGAVADVADHHGRLLLAEAVATGADDHVPGHGGSEHVAAVRRDPADAEADETGGVRDVVVLEHFPASAVDRHALPAPGAEDRVV